MMLHRVLRIALCFGLLLSTIYNLNARHINDSLASAKLIPEFETLFLVEDYEKLKVRAIQALEVTAKDDWHHQYLFNWYVGQSFRNQENDSAIKYYQRAAFYAKKSGLRHSIVNANVFLLFAYDRCMPGCLKKRDLLYEEIKHLSIKEMDIKDKILLFSGMLDYYYQTGQEQLYFPLLLKAVSYSEFSMVSGKALSLDSNNLGVLYQNLGDCYIETFQTSQAKEYYSKSRLFIRDYRLGVANYYMGMVEVYFQEKNDSAVNVYMDSLTVFSRQGGDGVMDVLMSANIELAILKVREKKLPMAWKYYQEACTFRYRTSNKLIHSRLQWVAALILIEEKRFKEALIYLKSIEQWVSGWSLEMYVPYVRKLAECYTGLKESQKAMTYYTILSPLVDSLYNKNLRQSKAFAEAKYQNERKTKEINNQKVVIYVAYKQNLWLMAALALMIAVLVLMYVIYFSKKKSAHVLNTRNIQLSKLNNLLDEANHSKAKLFSIISHDLRVPISELYQFLEIQHSSNDLLGVEEKVDMEEEIRLGTGSLLDTIEDLLLWSKSQLEFLKVSMQDVDLTAIFQQCQNLLHLNIHSKGIQIKNAIPDDCHVKSDINFLQVILRNLLYNAIKVSPEKGNLEVTFHRFGYRNYPTLILKNYGASFTQEMYSSFLENNVSSNLGGMGLRLVDELSRKVQIEIRYESKKENETICYVIFRNE